MSHTAFLVCTRNRLALLADCIASIEAQQVPDGVTVDIVIADNSEHGDEAAIRAVCPRAHYTHEPRRGYSNIRNAALDCALAQTPANLFVFIDDDVLAAPDMLAQHMQTLHWFSADVSAGKSAPSKHKDGDVITRVGTENVAFKRWIAELCLFCPEANLLGAEDIEFFYDAATFGAKMVHAPKALVSDNAAVSTVYPNFDMHVLRRAQARNDIHLDRVRRGTTYAAKRYAKRYAMRLFKGCLAAAAASITGSARLHTASRKNLAMHRGAVEGLFMCGVDRDMAKRGKLVEVSP